MEKNQYSAGISILSLIMNFCSFSYIEFIYNIILYIHIHYSDLKMAIKSLMNTT